jgi:peptidoglycan/xylan/chitin deacetylase (PgdA/CDA1 family)
VESGQVQIANHTWSHPDLRRLSDARVQEEIERNEEWIQRLFGVTARPWFRPPFGLYSDRVEAIAGELGYTRVLLWNGTLGDSGPISTDDLLQLAERYCRSGAVVLGHANHPTVLPLLDQLRTLLSERQLRPVTLDTMFGTSRRRG